METVKEDVRSLQIGERVERQNIHARRLRGRLNEAGVPRLTLRRVDHRTAWKLQKDQTGGRIFVIVEDAPEPAAAIARDFTGSPGRRRQVEGPDIVPYRLRDAIGKPDGAVTPVDGNSAEVSGLARVNVVVSEAVRKPVRRARQARARIGQKRLDVVAQNHPAEEAAEKGVQANRESMHGFGKSETIAETEFHDEIVLIARALLEFDEGIVIRVGIERENDGGEAAAGGIGGAQRVIPDARRSAGHAEIPEVEAAAGGCVSGAGGEAFGDARIADNQDFGPSAGRRAPEPMETGFESACARIRLEELRVPAGAEKKAVGSEKRRERQQDPQNTGNDAARADFSMI